MTKSSVKRVSDVWTERQFQCVLKVLLFTLLAKDPFHRYRLRNSEEKIKMSRCLFSAITRISLKPYVRSNVSTRVRRKHTVTNRKATMDDLRGVVAIREVYSGRDYLENKFAEFINCPYHTSTVSVIDGEIVAFTAGYVVDDGETIIHRGGRIKEKYQGQGIITTLTQFVENLCAVTGKLKRVGFTTAKLNVHSHACETLLVKNVICYTFKLEDLKKLPNDLPNRTEVLQKENLEEVFSSGTTCRHLFPENKIVVNWVPFRPLVSNASHIIKPDTVTIATPADTRDIMYSFISCGSYFYCKTGMDYTIDAFGYSMDEFRTHIPLHVKTMNRVADGKTVSLCIITQPDINREHVDLILSETDLPKYADDNVFRKMQVFERDFEPA